MNETGNYNIKWNKAHSDKQHSVSFICGLWTSLNLVSLTTKSKIGLASKALHRWPPFIHVYFLSLPMWIRVFVHIKPNHTTWFLIVISGKIPKTSAKRVCLPLCKPHFSEGSRPQPLCAHVFPLAGSPYSHAPGMPFFSITIYSLFNIAEWGINKTLAV